jgi:hypothetical protein
VAHTKPIADNFVSSIGCIEADCVCWRPAIEALICCRNARAKWKNYGTETLERSENATVPHHLGLLSVKVQHPVLHTAVPLAERLALAGLLKSLTDLPVGRIRRACRR